MREDPRPSSTNAIVLRQVLDRARTTTVPGELGIAIARYIDATERGPDEAEFTALGRAHRAALVAARDIAWCVRRFGGDADLRLVAADVVVCARWLDEAWAALEAAQRPPSPVRLLARRVRRRAAGPGRMACAREYAHAAMVFSERLADMRELALASR